MTSHSKCGCHAFYNLGNIRIFEDIQALHYLHIVLIPRKDSVKQHANMLLCTITHINVLWYICHNHINLIGSLVCLLVCIRAFLCVYRQRFEVYIVTFFKNAVIVSFYQINQSTRCYLLSFHLLTIHLKISLLVF